MSGSSDDQIENEDVASYLLKINEALGELTVDEVRHVVLEIEAHQIGSAMPAITAVDKERS